MKKVRFLLTNRLFLFFDAYTKIVIVRLPPTQSALGGSVTIVDEAHLAFSSASVVLQIGLRDPVGSLVRFDPHRSLSQSAQYTFALQLDTGTIVPLEADMPPLTKRDLCCCNMSLPSFRGMCLLLAFQKLSLN